MKFFSLGIAASPTVTSSSSLLGDEDILRVIELGIRSCPDSVDDLDKSDVTLGSRSTRMERGM